MADEEVVDGVVAAEVDEVAFGFVPEVVEGVGVVADYEACIDFVGG